MVSGMLTAILGPLLCFISAAAPGDPFPDPTAATQCLPVLQGTVDRSHTTIKLRYGGWPAHDIVDYVASIILREYLGYSVEIVLPSPDVLADIADDKVAHVDLVTWISPFDAPYIQYITNEKRVVDHGTIGFTGLGGMFVTKPVELLQQNRFALIHKFYESASEASALGVPLFSAEEAEKLKQALIASDEYPVCDPTTFVWCGTGGVENFWIPPQCQASPSDCILFVMDNPGFGSGSVEQLTRNLGLQAVHGYYGGQLEAHVQERLDQDLPTVFYHYRPSPMTLKFKAVQIQYPDHTPGCDLEDNQDPNTGNRTCGSQEVGLWKSSTPELRELMPEALLFIMNYHFLLTDIEAMLESTTAGGGAFSPAEAACEWIKSQTNSEHNKIQAFVPDCIVKPSANPVAGDLVFDPDLFACVPLRTMRTYLSPLSCFSPPPAENDRSDISIRVAHWDWDSNDLSNRLAELILKEFLGYTVYRVEAHESGQTDLWWDYITSEFYDFDAESWQAGPGTPDRLKYIEKGSAVIDFGSIGYTGRAGMFTFAFATEQDRFSDYFSFFKEASDAFNIGFPRFGDVNATTLLGDSFPGACAAPWCGTGKLAGSWAPPACSADPYECVDAYMYRTAWDAAYFEQLTRNLNLQLVHTYLYDKLRPALKQRYEQQLPTIFYWYEPSSLLLEYQLKRVSYPRAFGCDFSDSSSKDPNTGSLACDYPVKTLSKLGTAQLRTRAPQAYFFLHRYLLEKGDIQELMRYTVEGQGMTTDEAVCAWAKANGQKIKDYAPDCITKIPNVAAGDVVFDSSTMECSAVTCPKNQRIRVRQGKDLDKRTDVDCELCALGEIPSEDQLSCTRCIEGTRVSDNGTYCEVCPIGRFQKLDGKTECTSCPVGEYNLAAGSASCEPCPVGAFFQAGGEGGWCHNCTAGRFTGEARMTSCISCPLGLYNDYAGATACSYCAKGSYADKEGSTRCEPCDGIKLTDSRGMISKADCLCPEGTYLPLHSSECQKCVDGMTCGLGSSMWHFEDLRQEGFPEDAERPIPLLEPGLYASVEAPLVVYACQSPTRCPGGAPGTCGPNLRGLACHECDDGFVWTGENCTVCTDFESSPLIFPTLPILGVPFVAIIKYATSGDPYEKWGSARAGFSSIFFVVLNHYQVISILRQTNLMPPQNVAQLWDATRATSDGTRLFKMRCVGFKTFTSRLVLKSLLPAVVFVGFVVTWALSQMVGVLGFKGFVMEPNRTLNAFFSLVFTFFAGIVEMAFEIFKCAPNPNGDQSLITDRGIVCGSAVWKGNLIISILSVLFWCVGFGAVFVRAIIIAPKNFNDPGMQTRWKFLFIKYREDVYWWAIVFLIKGLLLNVGFLFLVTGTAQILWQLTMLMWYAGVTSMYRPWRHIAVNLVDVWSHLSLVLICAILTWFARESLGDETHGMKSILGRMLLASTFMCFGVVPLVGTYITWRDKSQFVRKARQDNINHLTWTFQRVVESDQQEFVKCMQKLGEWDFFFINQAYRIISTEYLKIHMRAGTSSQTGSAGAEYLEFEKQRFNWGGKNTRHERRNAAAYQERMNNMRSTDNAWPSANSMGSSPTRSGSNIPDIMTLDELLNGRHSTATGSTEERKNSQHSHRMSEAQRLSYFSSVTSRSGSPRRSPAANQDAATIAAFEELLGRSSAMSGEETQKRNPDAYWPSIPPSLSSSPMRSHAIPQDRSPQLSLEEVIVGRSSAHSGSTEERKNSKPNSDAHWVTEERKNSKFTSDVAWHSIGSREPTPSFQPAPMAIAQTFTSEDRSCGKSRSSSSAEERNNSKRTSNAAWSSRRSTPAPQDVPLPLDDWFGARSGAAAAPPEQGAFATTTERSTFYHEETNTSQIELQMSQARWPDDRADFDKLKASFLNMFGSGTPPRTTEFEEGPREVHPEGHDDPSRSDSNQIPTRGNSGQMPTRNDSGQIPRPVFVQELKSSKRSSDASWTEWRSGPVAQDVPLPVPVEEWAGGKSSTATTLQDPGAYPTSAERSMAFHQEGSSSHLELPDRSQLDKLKANFMNMFGNRAASRSGDGEELSREMQSECVDAQDVTRNDSGQIPTKCSSGQIPRLLCAPNEMADFQGNAEEGWIEAPSRMEPDRGPEIVWPQPSSAAQLELPMTGLAPRDPRGIQDDVMNGQAAGNIDAQPWHGAFNFINSARPSIPLALPIDEMDVPAAASGNESEAPAGFGMGAGLSSGMVSNSKPGTPEQLKLLRFGSRLRGKMTPAVRDKPVKKVRVQEPGPAVPSLLLYEDDSKLVSSTWGHVDESWASSSS